MNGPGKRELQEQREQFEQIAHLLTEKEAEEIMNENDRKKKVRVHDRPMEDGGA